MEKNFDEVTFVKDFVELADMHNSCLATKDYSKRSRCNKKLLGMLKTIDDFSNPEDVISKIIASGNDYAVMWIANYAWKNGHCVDLIKEKLNEIKTQKRGPDAITAWALMVENTL